MAFLDIRFPTNISFNAVGGPGFQTDIVMTNGGAESRNQVWQYELNEYEVSHAARLPVDYKALQAFFRVAAGMANTFRYKDWTDYQATTVEGKFVAIAGSSTTWQMVKRYTSGAYTLDRKITKPVSGLATASAGSIDFATGIVTNGSMPAYWSGDFDNHCRFGTDKMRAETIDKSGGSLVIGWSSIPVLEVRE